MTNSQNPHCQLVKDRSPRFDKTKCVQLTYPRLLYHPQ
jgi:hypothetical protein